MSTTSDRRWTATVIGGGPAGLMAAEVLAGAGCSVTVHDHMASMGRKLLLAGRGGLNITHSEPTEELLERYGPARTRLESAIRRWPAAALRAWCADLGEPTFVGSSGRVFPQSFRATPLLRAWLARLSATGVRLETRHRFVGFASAPTAVLLDTPGGRYEIETDVVVLALGGASWPRVGSDGAWVPLIREAEVRVSALRPANCGLCVAWRPDWLERHEGAPIKNVRLTLDGVDVRGDMVITRAGVEGGPIYALAAAARDTIERDGSCTITVDLSPDLAEVQLAERIARARPGDSTTTVLRRAGLAAEAASLVRELGGRQLPAAPADLALLVKRLPLVTSATMPIDRAISSAGGVGLDEVDERFMLRRKPGVFVAGEMLDWEAPTGGYLLQASFSTAVAAAEGALAWLAERPVEPDLAGET
ncbi:MAG: TIGR03862 family flavoprotein [Acidimicrobiales bacterium]|nr:TIGR03862 family flavoprotein [Acidimicrobiales bacterium]MCB9392807.1 TIGR03862 family flavoprotein [Acidimicrobiaceae bacterium]